jgi:hypothetical protein
VVQGKRTNKTKQEDEIEQQIKKKGFEFGRVAEARTILTNLA